MSTEHTRPPLIGASQQQRRDYPLVTRFTRAEGVLICVALRRIATPESMALRDELIEQTWGISDRLAAKERDDAHLEVQVPRSRAT